MVHCDHLQSYSGRQVLLLMPRRDLMACHAALLQWLLIHTLQSSTRLTQCLMTMTTQGTCGLATGILDMLSSPVGLLSPTARPPSSAALLLAN